MKAAEIIQRRAVVAEMAATGMSRRAIARAIGVTHGTVSRDLRGAPIIKRQPVPLKDRILKHIAINEVTGCWEWTARISDNGYGCMSSGAPGAVILGAHRNAYVAFVGPIPEGYDIDHVCHTESDCVGGRTCLHRRCVNPDHLEAVTRLENIRRGRQCDIRTHCPQGHALEGRNLYIEPSAGTRRCRPCIYRSMAASRRRKKAAQSKECAA